MKLYPYQRTSVHQINRFDGRALLGHEMGLGKTIISLAYLRDHPEAFPALVVCPASVKYNWQHECRQFLHRKSTVLEGRTPNGVRPKSITIINYDILKDWVPWIKEHNFKTLVLDECHMIKDRNTQRYKATKAVARPMPQCLALSGTPLLSKPSELWPALNILRPNVFTSFWKFGKRYCKPRMTPWGVKYDGASNTSELNDLLLENGLIRYLKEDVLTELPDKVRRVMPLEMSDFSEYAEARDNYLQWLKNNRPKKHSRSQAALALRRTGDLIRLASRLKLRGVVDWANRFIYETDEKLVLFAIHKKCIRVLERRIDAKSVTIDGSVTGRKRQASVDQFRQDKKTRLLIGNIKAAGVGINLVESSTVGFAEMWWNPGDLLQCEDRVHRIGQTRPPWIYYFVAAGSIEETLCRINQEKQRTIRAVLDGRTVQNDMDVYNQLIREITKGRT